MKITEVIEKCDAFYPNEYTFGEKLYWAYEVSCRIANEIKENFARITLDKDDGDFVIPPGVEYEDIYKVICDGREIKKVDDFNLKDFDRGIFDAKKVEIVIKKRPVEYKEKIYEGVFNFEYSAEDDTSTFLIPGNEIYEGDTLKILGSEYEVVKADGDEIKINGEISGENECGVEVVIDDETLCGAPYEAMYIYYIIAQILFNQSDVEGYNRYITMFQSLFTEYAMYYRRNAPDYSRKFKNVW